MITLVTINVKEITGNSNKNNQFHSLVYFHFVKLQSNTFTERTQPQVGPENGRQYECERAVHYPYIHLLIGRDAGIAVKRLLTLGLVKCDWLC